MEKGTWTMTQKPSQADDERYIAWRTRVPFSNEAVAQIYERLAAESRNAYRAQSFQSRATRLRSGARLGKRDLYFTLDRLITVCALCGGPALYRYGSEGRCRTHRTQAPAFFSHKRLALEARSAAISASKSEQQRDDRLRQLQERYQAYTLRARHQRRK